MNKINKLIFGLFFKTIAIIFYAVFILGCSANMITAHDTILLFSAILMLLTLLPASLWYVESICEQLNKFINN